jgi:nitrate/TMAO reductase-like tetraheme cytochrome c subunit
LLPASSSGAASTPPWNLPIPSLLHFLPRDGNAKLYQELQPTIHYSNRSGVRATCPTATYRTTGPFKVARKMEASKEVWGWLFGTINTHEKYEAAPGDGPARMGPV